MIILTPPILSEKSIKEKIVCIRGHRERIFRVEPEKIVNKIVFHNYGHGGAGWTFLFGTVYQSIEQFRTHTRHAAFKSVSVTVIGAGCYGLLTAIILAREGYRVTIVAKEIEGLASQKAAGFFFPRPRKVSNAGEIALFHQFGFASYTAYIDIIAGKHPYLRRGARLLSAYYDPRIDPGFGPYIERGLMQNGRPVTICFDGGSREYEATEYTALFIETHELLSELWRNVTELDILIKRDTVTHFQEIDDCIIFNCTGFGARSLAQDNRMVPVQGHLVLLHNQPDSMQRSYMVNMQVDSTDIKGRPRTELIYYAPKGEGILGITFIRGESSLTANEHEFDRLWQRCKIFFEQ